MSRFSPMQHRRCIALPRLFRSIAAMAVVAMSGLLLFTASAAAADDSDGPPSASVGVVYVESNITSANSILAYTRGKNGTLTPLPGSPFSTHGKGVIDPSLKLGPFDADQLIVANPQRTLLFAVNPGSNTVAAFHIRPDGTLYDVEGSPFPSGGSNPVSLGLSRGTLVVVNKAMDPQQPTGQVPNYVSFDVTADGKLIPTPVSTIAVPVGNSPSQALVAPSQRLVFGADFLGGLLQSFQVDFEGALLHNAPQALPASEFAGSAAPPLPLGLTVHPNRAVVYVGFVTINKVGVYLYDDFGKLSFVRTVADSGTAVCWLRMNAEGTRLYASNTGDNSISVFDTTDPLSPREIQHIALRGDGSSFQIELDPRGEYLFAVSQRADAATPLGKGNNLHVLRVLDDGRLAQSKGPLALPVPGDVRPQGLATF